MHSFQSYEDHTHSFEGVHFQYPSIGHYDHANYAWMPSDTALTQLQHEYDPQQKYIQNAQTEVFEFQQSVTNLEHLQDFQQVIGIPGPSADPTSWSLSHDTYRYARYNSPNGLFGGTLSTSSSDYGLSPEIRGSSIAISNGSQVLAFAANELDPNVSQQDLWTADKNCDSLLSLPPDGTTTTTQAIAPQELFSGVPDYYYEPYHLEEGTKSVLPMRFPEELELTDSIATLTTSSRSNTVLTPNSAQDESEFDERDHESDLDFLPRSLSSARRSSNLPVRTIAQPRSPRRNASIQSYPVQDPKSRVQKPARRSASNGSKEKRKPKTSIRPVLTKSYSAGSTNKAPKYFPCAFHMFGCVSTFANKNEWKRHISSQHLQLGFFRCDLGDCNPNYIARYHLGNESRHRRKSSNTKQDECDFSYNDFNRKDLFTQHCRRMHGPQRYATDNTSVTNQRILERADRLVANLGSKSRVAKPIVTKDDEADFEVELEHIRKRCWQTRRKAPTRSCCGFCNKVFQVDSISSKTNHNEDSDDDDGKAEEKAWEERMEHIGKHYERDSVQARAEGIDEDLEAWGLHTGVLEQFTDVKGHKQSWLAGHGPPTNESAIIKDEDVESSPRRSGLRTRAGRTNPAGKTEQYIKEEDEEKHDESEDDASGEDE